MTAYYNENDPFAAAWLRELIAQGVIADGEVDARSIKEVTAADLRGFTQCHFFAGIGVWAYALAAKPDAPKIVRMLHGIVPVPAVLCFRKARRRIRWATPVARLVPHHLRSAPPVAP